MEQTQEKPGSYFYWDGSVPNIVIETSTEIKNYDDLTFQIIDLQKAKSLFEKGFINKTDIQRDKESYTQLKKYITSAALSYYINHRKPFILLNIRSQPLNEFQIKCIFEYIINTDIYTVASKFKDPICFVRLGWWQLNDIINKYKDVVRLGRTEYDYTADNKW